MVMWQVTGQSRAVDFLKSGLEKGRLSHAYLFVGPKHVGKMTLAVNLAQALNCEVTGGDSPWRAEERPCSQCNSCSRIIAGKHADVQIIGLDKSDADSGTAKEIGIEAIRDMERSAFLKPFEGKHRVYIIDGADRLTVEAANCLLKTLEEPPPCVTMILLAVDEGQILPTVLSRCQHIELHPVPLEMVKNVLVKRGVAEEKAEALARLSKGCVGWALQASSNEEVLAQRTENIAELVRLCAEGRSQRFKYAAHLANIYAKDKEAVQNIIEFWLSWWRDLLLTKVGAARLTVNIDQIQELERQAEGLGLGEITEFIHCIQYARRQLHQNANPRLVLEVLMLDVPS